MKQRILVSLVVVLLIAAGVFLWNQNRVSSREGLLDLVVAVENDIGSLDPIRIVDSYNLRIGSQIFEGLVTLNASNELEPRLAEKWESNEDATVWTFQIRPGVRFHPHTVFGPAGTRELTAEDVAYGLTRILSKDSASSFALVNIVAGGVDYQKGNADTVSGIKVTDPLTVQISLTAPDPLFLHRITSPWYAIVPREAVELGPDKFGLTDLPATGPFRLKSFSENNVVLERSPDYWRNTGGNVESLTFKTIKNAQFRLNELRNQRLDVTRLEADLSVEATSGSPDSDGKIALRSAYASHSQAAVFPVLNSYFLGFNTEVVPPALRQAISSALQRGEIAQATAGPLGYANPSPLPTVLRPPTTPAAVSPLPPLSSADQARELEVLVYDKENAERIGELIQAQCAVAGIKIKLTKLDFNAVVGKIIDGSAEAYVANFDYAFTRPELILGGFFSKELIPIPNLFRYNSPEAMTLIARLAATKDPDASLRVAAELEQLIIRDVPAAFLFEKRAAVAWRSDLRGVRLTRNNLLPFEEIIVP